MALEEDARWIGWLDPSLHSANRGDDIIADAVRQVWRELGVSEPDRIPTQKRMKTEERVTARSKSALFVGGTNLLSSNMPWYRQWKIGPADAVALSGRVVLLGVGWWQYQGPPNRYTAWFLRTVLGKDLPHSARDNYTAERLRTLGLSNVRNTGCPTTWWLEDCPEKRYDRAREVVLALTDYNRDPGHDRWLYNTLVDHYDRVYLWPQSSKDIRYAYDLGIRPIVLPPTLEAFDGVLEGGKRDFVGTRLHGGIRALSHGSRSSIVAVDNRATEMGRDIGLPVAPRADTDALAHLITAPRALRLHIDRQAIQSWLADVRTLISRISR